MIKADNNGLLKGSFTIPANVRAGAKTINFVGKGGSTAQAVFVGQGNITTQTLRQVSTITRNWYDPLAQTFVLEENTPLVGVDLWFTAKGTKKVIVQIRETNTGFPNQNILAAQTIQPQNIFVNNTATRILFDTPVHLQAKTEYAIVVLTDDNKTALSVAELGKFDTISQRWITAQPYTVGVLLSSSNASTWTPHQNMDLTFRLLKATYKATSKSLALGEADVNNSTDLMLLALAEKPSVETRTLFVLKLPDNSELEIAENQSLRLPQNLSGKIEVRAKLFGSQLASPILLKGSQLIAAQTAACGDYITRAIKAGASSRVKIIFDALLPAGSSIEVSLADAEAVNWTPISLHSSQPLDNNFREYQYEGAWSAETVRCKLTLSGSTQARPRVKNFRMLAL